MRACDSKQDMYTASVDSVLEIGAYAFWQHREGNFLYSAAIAQSTMDYSLKAIKDGVVNSPLNREVPITMNSLSLLQGKAMMESSKSKWRDSNGAQCNLYMGLSPAAHQKMYMVQVLYHLPFSCLHFCFFGLLCNPSKSPWMELIFVCVLEAVPKSWRFTQSVHSLPLSTQSDSVLYSFDNEERTCVESRLASCFLKRSTPEWKIISCRKQERESKFVIMTICLIVFNEGLIYVSVI